MRGWPTGFRFTVSGRSDDMFRVRGVNVFPSAVEELLREHGIDRFAIVLERFPVEPPVRILVEVPGHARGGAGGCRPGPPRVHLRDLDGDTAAPRGEVEASHRVEERRHPREPDARGDGRLDQVVAAGAAQRLRPGGAPPARRPPRGSGVDRRADDRLLRRRRGVLVGRRSAGDGSTCTRPNGGVRSKRSTG